MEKKKVLKKTKNKEKPEIKHSGNEFKPFYSHNRTTGQKAADVLTKWAGSWTFIIFVLVFISFWIYLNMTAYINNWDPWPFIILNLCLSCLAALQAPVILMSQNRSAQRDRLKAENDYHVNREAKKEIEQILRKLTKIEKKVFK